MKKILAAAWLISVCTVLAYGQRTVDGFCEMKSDAPAAGLLRDFTDTIVPVSFVPVFDGGLGCFTGIYASSDSGYVTGNNSYGDLEKAQFFALSSMGLPDSGLVQSVLVHFAYTTQSIVPGNCVAKIYDSDSGYIHPGLLLGTSDPVNLAVIPTDGAGVVFSFPEPVSVRDSFFVSVVLPVDSGDTAVILSTVNGCVAFPGWSFELWNDGTWHSLQSSWILNVDLAVFPVVDLIGEVGIDPAVELERVARVYPNPVDGFFAIEWKQEPGEGSKLMVTDVWGRIIHESVLSGAEPVQKFDSASWPSGVYSLQVHAGLKRYTALLIKQ